MNPYDEPETRPDEQGAQPAPAAKSFDLQVLLGERPMLDTAAPRAGRAGAARDAAVDRLRGGLRNAADGGASSGLDDAGQRDREAMARVRAGTMASRRRWLEGLLRIGVGVQALWFWYQLGSGRGFFSVAALLGLPVGAGLYLAGAAFGWRAGASGFAAMAGYIALLFVGGGASPGDLFGVLGVAILAAVMGGERHRAAVE